MSRKEPEVFSLSAIDLFACSFGAVVLMMVLYVSEARKSDHDDEALLGVTFSVWHWAPHLDGIRVGVMVDDELIWPESHHHGTQMGRDDMVEVSDAALPGVVDPTSGWRATEVHEWTIAVRDHRGPRKIALILQDLTSDPDRRRLAGAGLPIRVDVLVTTSTGPTLEKSYVLVGGRQAALANERAGDPIHLEVIAGGPGEEPPAEIRLRVTPRESSPWPSGN